MRINHDKYSQKTLKQCFLIKKKIKILYLVQNISMISDALGSELISRVVGYKLTTGNFQDTTPNLPQKIALFGEANTANQATYPTAPTQINSQAQAGTLYGFGSPIHMAARILFPINGSGIGGIPVVVFPQAESGSAVAKEIEITVTGTVTAAATHYVVIGGRYGIDGNTYAINVVVSDTVTTIAAKIATAINSVLSSPVTATSALGVVTLVAKCASATMDSLTAIVDTNDNAVGVTYASASSVTGVGVPTVTTALETFGNEWYTVVINTYGTENTAIMAEFEAFNGVPDPDAPTGRYAPQILKPFICLTGSVEDEDTTITDAKKDNVTIAVCPAPLSSGMQFEAAANMALLFARISQDTPHLDVAGRSYLDMPTPLSIGTMASYANRDAYVKLGNSTVDLVSGKYQNQDFVTTYHPLGEFIPQFRYARNLMIDFNVRYGYFLLEQLYVVDKMIAADNDTVTVSNVVKPKTWKAILFDYADDLASRGIITDAQFMKDSIQVGLSSVNPDRLETFFRYKRTGFARVLPTTAEAGFNFG